MEIYNIFEIAATGVMGVIGYFVRSHDRRIERIEDTNIKTQTDLSNHKLDSEKRFAKEETLQSSLSRIHDRLDRLPDDIIKIVDRNKK